MQVQRYKIAVTTAADGSATAYTTDLQGNNSPITGRVLAIVVSVNNLTAGAADLTFTVEGTGESILTLTNLTGTGPYYPRVGTHSTAGAAALYAAGGTAVNDYVAMDQDRVKLVVAQGGNVLTATIFVIVG